MVQGLGWRIGACWMRLRANRKSSVIIRRESIPCPLHNPGQVRNRRELEQRPQFGVAKTEVNRLELEIVRCVLAPPERVCLEIMS
jgi:hypothetical protein